jgi:hypothetical protein
MKKIKNRKLNFEKITVLELNDMKIISGKSQTIINPYGQVIVPSATSPIPRIEVTIAQTQSTKNCIEGETF